MADELGEQIVTCKDHLSEKIELVEVRAFDVACKSEEAAQARMDRTNTHSYSHDHTPSARWSASAHRVTPHPHRDSYPYSWPRTPHPHRDSYPYSVDGDAPSHHE